MPKLPGISHKRAVKAFEKADFRIIRQGKHISMTDGDPKGTRSIIALSSFPEAIQSTPIRWLELLKMLG